MTLKARDEDYFQEPSRLPASVAVMQQELTVPQMLFSESTQTLFYSKELQLPAVNA